MDDIWNTEVWNEVSTAFPNNSKGSRILITSRIKEVALHASSVNNSVPIPPYEFHFLKKIKVGYSSLRRCFEEQLVLQNLRL